MTYVYFKDLLAIFLPFVLINIFFQYFYQVSLFSVVIWWGKNLFNIEDKAFYFVGLFFTLVIMFVSIGTVIQTISLAFHGETQKMLYVGNINEQQSILYYENDLTLKPLKYSQLSSPALTFNSIYTTTEFSKDKGTNRVGAPTKGYSFQSVFIIIWITFALLPIMFVVGHAFAYHVLAGLELNDFHLLEMKSAFESVFAPLGLTIKRMTIFSCSFLCSLFILLPLFGRVGAYLEDSKGLPLPDYIKSGYELTAIPVNSFRETVKGTSVSSGHMSEHDSGYRYTIYKFEDGFQIPTYIAYRYHYKDHPDFEALSRSHINQGVAMWVKVLDDLSIQPVI